PEHVSYPHINVAGCSRRLVVPGLRHCCAEPAPAPAWGRNPASAPGDTAPDKPSPPPSAPNHVGRLALTHPRFLDACLRRHDALCTKWATIEQINPGSDPAAGGIVAVSSAL